MVPCACSALQNVVSFFFGGGVGKYPDVFDFRWCAYIISKYGVHFQWLSDAGRVQNHIINPRIKWYDRGRTDGGPGLVMPSPTTTGKKKASA